MAVPKREGGVCTYVGMYVLGCRAVPPNFHPLHITALMHRGGRGSMLGTNMSKIGNRWHICNPHLRANLEQEGPDTS